MCMKMSRMVHRNAVTVDFYKVSVWEENVTKCGPQSVLEPIRKIQALSDPGKCYLYPMYQ